MSAVAPIGPATDLWARAGLLNAGLVSERRVGTKRLFRARPEGLDDLRAFLADMWPMALGRFKAAAEAGAQEMEPGTPDAVGTSA